MESAIGVFWSWEVGVLTPKLPFAHKPKKSILTIPLQNIGREIAQKQKAHYNNYIIFISAYEQD